MKEELEEDGVIVQLKDREVDGKTTQEALKRSVQLFLDLSSAGF